MSWGYVVQHPEIILGWLLVAVCAVTAAAWSAKVIVAKLKYTYKKEKDKAWQEEHRKRVESDKRCDQLLDTAQKLGNNYRIALLTLRRIERDRKNKQKAD